jgi:hypothetical protein
MARADGHQDHAQARNGVERCTVNSSRGLSTAIKPLCRSGASMVAQRTLPRSWRAHRRHKPQDGRVDHTPSPIAAVDALSIQGTPGDNQWWNLTACPKAPKYLRDRESSPGPLVFSRHCWAEVIGRCPVSSCSSGTGSGSG